MNKIEKQTINEFLNEIFKPENKDKLDQILDIMLPKLLKDLKNSSNHSYIK